MSFLSSNHFFIFLFVVKTDICHAVTVGALPVGEIIGKGMRFGRFFLLFL